MKRRRRLSIPTRVFLGFALLITGFAVVSLVSVLQHEKTAGNLVLLHDGYLPLALTIGQARADQTVLSSLLDRVLEERDTTATRSWLNAARRVRPVTLDNALEGVDHAESLDPPAEDRVILWSIRSQLEEIRSSYGDTDADYDVLFQALSAADEAAATEALNALKAHERGVRNRLRRVWRRLNDRIATVSASAAVQEQQAAYLLGALTAFSFLIGIVVLWWSQRMLSPLPGLQERVAAVAGGDLTAKLRPDQDDELGRLAAEFERMVEAIAARDARLRDAADAQRRLQRMQVQIVADLRAAVVVVDGERVVRTVNPSAHQVLGLSAAVTGQNLATLGLFRELPALEAAIAEVVEGAERAVLSAVPFGESGRVVNLLVTPFGGRGDVGWVLIVAEDVSVEVRTKARLIHTERLAAIGRMAAHVTHEVRNPLSSIGLNVEMLEEELEGTGGEARALLQAIHGEIDRLTAITQEYLRLARLPDPHLEPEDVETLIRSVVEFVRKELEAASVRVDLVIEPGLPPVPLDEAQLRQALLNLLRNARDAMPSGGTVIVRAHRGEGGVIIRVADQGKGVPEGERERIFDLFFTTKDRGSGLGLPLTQQIVVAHGGRIRCDQNPGGGASFELWLPAALKEELSPQGPLVATGT